MTAARRERLRKLLVERTQQANPQSFTALTRERLKVIENLPNAERLIPLIYNFGFVLRGKKVEGAQVHSACPDDAECRRRIVTGRFFNAPDERAVVVSEFLAYRLGLVDDADVDALIGTPLRIEFRSNKSGEGLFVTIRKQRGSVSREERAALDKVRTRLPAALDNLDLTKQETDLLHKALDENPPNPPEVYTEQFTVVGVIREASGAERENSWDLLRVNSDLLLPYQTAMDVYFYRTNQDDQGLERAVLFVNSEKNVRDAVNRIQALGLYCRSAIQFIEHQQLVYLLIFGGMTCVAAVALLVSALGIANTMLMSVLERTREIGIMKAVGADNRQLQFVFLVEGALLGLLGAGLGLLLAWIASYPGDSWVRSLVMRDLKIDLKGSIFVFPLSMSLTVVLFTVLVTTLAAAYPARHAARIDPVAALRHE